MTRLMARSGASSGLCVLGTWGQLLSCRKGAKSSWRLASRALIVLAVGSCFVHAQVVSPALAQKDKDQVVAAKQRADISASDLPVNVRDLREAILLAVQSGRIEDIKTAIEWNEIPPDFGPEVQQDPIGMWKRQSADGEGREFLAAIANVLALPPARVAIGKDAENTIVFVWPYLAEKPLDRLSEAEQVDLMRLVSPERAKLMQTNKKWAWWRLAISADGTWLLLRKY